MSTKMESRQCTPSVIARLMGLDELSPRQPVQKKQKVLSENYLRRVASIGVRGKHSFHERHSFRLSDADQKEFKDAFEGHGKTKRVEDCNLKGTSESSLSTVEVQNAEAVADSKINLFMKYLQEPEPFITKHPHDLQGIPALLQSGFLTVLKLSIDKKHKEFLSPEKGNLCVVEEERNNVPKDMEPVRSRYRISREISRQTGQGKNSLFTTVSKAGSRDNGSFAEDSQLKAFSSPSYCDSKNHSDESYVAREARKEILERWKTTKMFQEVEVPSWNRTLGEMLTMSDQESSPHNSDLTLHEHGQNSQTGLRHNLFMRKPEKRLQHRFRKQGHNQKEGSEYRNSGSSCMESRSVPRLKLRNSYSPQDDCVLQSELKRKLVENTCEQAYMIFKPSSFCSSTPDSATQEVRGVQDQQQQKLEEKDLSEQSYVVAKSSVNCVAAASMVAEMVSKAETGAGGQSSENHKEQHLKMTDCMLLMANGFSSHVPDDPTRQDKSIGIFKGDFVSSFGSCRDPESLVNFEEVYQPSPNSVLEPPFEKDISSSFGYCQGVNSNLHGLQLQLELLKSESSEAYPEGAGMIVSSDDDSEEGSVSHSRENEQFMRIFSIEESRDFSYLVDVFTEASYHGRNSGMSYEIWHSPECPISPTVFEMLEKKYGEQMSWKRSERLLLFDRINLEVMEILKPSSGVHGTKPLSTRLLFGKNFDMIEEELWMLLVHREKQANNDSFMKLVKDDKWLELGDDIEVIVREIENSMIDRLAEEVVSMESF